jgi:rhodanese-related sulfurtransferase
MPRGKLEFHAAAGLLGGTDNELILYCKKDSRAAFGCQTLQNLGFENVKNLAGGLKAWAEAEYSIYNQHGELTVKEYGKNEKEN